MTRRVVFAPEAQADLLQLYQYIAGQSGAARALDYTERIVTHCQSFSEFPERGTLRDDLRPGLRITAFARRVTITFHGGHGGDRPHPVRRARPRGGAVRRWLAARRREPSAPNAHTTTHGTTAALAAGADCIVTGDRDLRVLGRHEPSGS
ncbi:MAG: type II toxin-antitoxin system RelE/ParE family toxin [Kiloniellales bacterium]|nr:type II toxin-antitoxin system RelE/ParE family toxin [Kiloniellales bacterium]